MRTRTHPALRYVAALSQTGTAQLLTEGTGSISVLASDVDYSLPSGVGVLTQLGFEHLHPRG